MYPADHTMVSNQSHHAMFAVQIDDGHFLTVAGLGSN